MAFHIHLVLIIYSVFSLTYVPAVRIAIVGAGIGGTSCAHFLKEDLGSSVDIDIYESGTVGGRVGTMNYRNNAYEYGASIVSAQNHYIVGFMNQFGLGKIPKSYTNLTNGIYDGRTFKRLTDDSPTYSQPAYGSHGYSGYGYGGYDSQGYSGYGYWGYNPHQYQRQGSDIVGLVGHIQKALQVFLKIYNIQNNNEAFENVVDMFDGIQDEFSYILNISTSEYFSGFSFSNRDFADKFILGALILNYGQTLDVPAMVGIVAMAGMMADNFQIYGGNKQIPELLLEKSNARLINRMVTRVKYSKSKNKYLVKSKGNYKSKSTEELYDYVVIATPIISNSYNNIEFEGIQRPSSGYYHKIYVTLVYGEIDKNYFRADSNFPLGYVVCVDESSPIYSAGVVSGNYGEEDDGESKVWKLFSSRELDRDDLYEVFHSYDSPERAEWLAFPSYPSYNDGSIRYKSFKLHNKLYYVNAIEWAASAMEMSVIGAKNVALLIKNQI